MSSFICDPKHFNSVENAVCDLIFDDQFFCPYSLKHIFTKWYNKTVGYSIDCQQAEIKEVFKTVRELSVLCVSLQYAHHHENVNEEIKKQTAYILGDTKDYVNLSKVELYKALQCIIYQIEKEHLTDLRPLTGEEEEAMEMLKNLVSALAIFIISKMPEYNSAKWEIE